MGSGVGFGIVHDGAHAQALRVPLAWLSEKPKHLSMEQSATVGIPFVAAWSAPITVAEIKARETVLITGASGAVGHAAREIARWKGARIISADRSDSPGDVLHINMAKQTSQPK